MSPQINMLSVPLSLKLLTDYGSALRQSNVTIRDNGGLPKWADGK